MDNWVIAITCTYPHEAHMAENYLSSHGIETYMKDELTVQTNIAYSNAIGGVKILVKESDYDQSILLLKEGGFITDQVDEIIWVEYSKDQKTCPFCHSENIVIKKRPNSISFILSIFISFIFFSVLAPIYKSEYTCFNCNKKWKYKRKNS